MNRLVSSEWSRILWMHDILSSSWLMMVPRTPHMICVSSTSQEGSISSVTLSTDEGGLRSKQDLSLSVAMRMSTLGSMWSRLMQMDRWISKKSIDLSKHSRNIRSSILWSDLASSREVWFAICHGIGVSSSSSEEDSLLGSYPEGLHPTHIMATGWWR